MPRATAANPIASAASAATAGLRYVADDRPGYRREERSQRVLTSGAERFEESQIRLVAAHLVAVARLDFVAALDVGRHGR